MTKISRLLLVFATALLSFNTYALDVNEKALYIVEAQKTADLSILGIKGSFKNSGKCVGDYEEICSRFLNSIDTDAVNKIIADLYIKEFSSEDIDNLYLYSKEGPGKKEVENILIQVKAMLNINPEEDAGEPKPLSKSEIAYRSKFNKTDTGMKLGEFLKVANAKIQAALGPYMTNLAKETGLTE